jgi:hypothetical protein
MSSVMLAQPVCGVYTLDMNITTRAASHLMSWLELHWLVHEAAAVYLQRHISTRPIRQ